MKNERKSIKQCLQIYSDLYQKGWYANGNLGEMTFMRNGKVYDLSAADLDQLDRIERKGLFLVN